MKIYQAVTSLAKFLIEAGALDKQYLIDAKRFRPKRHLPEKKHSVDQKSLDKLNRIQKGLSPFAEEIF